MSKGMKKYIISVMAISVIMGTISTSCENRKENKSKEKIIKVPPVTNEQLVDEYYDSVYGSEDSTNYYDYEQNAYTYSKTK